MWGNGQIRSPREEEPAADRKARYVRNFVLAFTTIGVGCVIIYSFYASLSWAWLKILGVGALIGAASFAIGGLLGFLFGIPRFADPQNPDAKREGRANSGDSQTAYRPNTNLEQISDWLTKIIVGVGLVELKGAPYLLQRLAYFLGSAFVSVGTPRNDEIAISIAILFSISGFFLSYLMARLFLQGALIAAESPIDKKIAQTVDKLGQTVATQPIPAIGAPIAKAQLEAGEKIKELSLEADIGSLRKRLLAIAAEYERQRSEMPSGDERTSKMEALVSQLRALAPSTYPLLDEMAAGDTAGKRLAAIAMLQVKPQPDYLGWLADRVTGEKPFIGYQAALALLYAVEKLGPKYRQAVLKAVLQAQAALAEKGLVDTDRMEVLERARKAASDVS